MKIHTNIADTREVKEITKEGTTELFFNEVYQETPTYRESTNRRYKTYSIKSRKLIDRKIENWLKGEN